VDLEAESALGRSASLYLPFFPDMYWNRIRKQVYLSVNGRQDLNARKNRGLERESEDLAVVDP